jgi:formate hydrogenlyase subunit 3/multisubunit Na+/H+ antiporter MnhD subunit
METPTPGVVTENPAIETASEQGRVIAGLPGLVHPGELPITYARRPLPFAAMFQAVLIVVMFVAFLLILQQNVKVLYQIGLPVLVVAAFLQIAFGNIPPNTRFVKSMGLLAMTWAIVAILIYVAVQITPSLIQLGQVRR